MFSDVNKLFVFKHLLKTPSNGLPLHLKQNFPAHNLNFYWRWQDGIESRLPFKIVFTLLIDENSPPSIFRPSDISLEAMEDAKRQFAAKARRCQQVAFCIVNTNYVLFTLCQNHFFPHFFGGILKNCIGSFQYLGVQTVNRRL